jgi:hypothetical protein
MPNLPPIPRPRLRRPPVGSSVAPGAAEVVEPRIVEAAGLRWIHIDDPRLAHREWREEHYESPSRDGKNIVL